MLKRIISAFFCVLIFSSVIVAQSNGPTAGTGQQTPPARFSLEDSTPIKLRIGRTVSSAESRPGDQVDFEVLEEVRVNGVLVVAKGGSAIGTVTEAEAKRRMARGGKLDINIDYVRLVDGEKAALRAVREVKGGGHTGAMTAGIVATSLVLWPAAPLFLFMHGKDISIPKGTEITAYINGDTPLDTANFRGSDATQASASSLNTIAIAQIEVASSPAGADIQIDGSFVGNTPSSIGVSAGDHDIRITKAGYNVWERRIRSSTGTVRVTAELEAVTTTLASTQQPVSNSSMSLARSDAAAEMDVEPSIGAWFSGNPTIRHDGVEVSGVKPNGVAEEVGIKSGTVILSIEGHYIYTIEDVHTELRGHPSGSRLSIKFQKGSLTYESFITLGPGS